MSRADQLGSQRLSPAVLSVADGVFFGLGAVAAAWLAVLTLRRLLLGGMGDWWLLLVLWVLLAYLLLPRVNTVLALVYVPGYFMGRTRTYEGLLGDPVNVALLGSEAQVHEGMSRAGWRLADELGFRSGLRIVTFTVSRRTYTTAPVSPLFLFGRMQDFTYQQEVEGSPARRHHVRFWRAPDDWYLPGGSRVDWLAAGTFDQGVGLSAFTLQVTHKIAKDTDLERDHIVDTVMSANPQARRSVIRHFSSGYHSRNGGGDAIQTDGDLPILDLTAVPAGDHGLPHATSRPTGSLATDAKVLLETVRDTAASNRIKRPMTLYVGYGVVLARALLAVATAGAALFGWLGTRYFVLAGAAVPPPAAVTVIVVAAIAYVLLGQLVFQGHQVARVLALAISVALIGAALLAPPASPHGLASFLQLTNLALDIAILITLSSSDIRDFHLRMRAHHLHAT